MIEKCNFKNIKGIIMGIDENDDGSTGPTRKADGCYLTGAECLGEDKCIQYQTYRILCVFFMDYYERLDNIRENLKKKGLIKDD